MKLPTTTVTGCGSDSCPCAGLSAYGAVPRINGVALHPPERRPARTELVDSVRDELLRQHAVALGLLPRHDAATAPEITQHDRWVIQAMVDRAVPLPCPDEEACRRYFEANKPRFMQGQALHVRHILFAVTPEVNVHALLLQAEQALLELSRPGVPAERFAQLAAELSGCPTATEGGDLGWLGPENCDPELANELFHHKHSRWGMGVHPRLIQTGHGFHILEVLGRRKGRPLHFQDVRERIGAELARLQRATAFQRYIAALAARAMMEGIEFRDLTMEWAEEPLLQ